MGINEDLYSAWQRGDLLSARELLKPEHADSLRGLAGTMEFTHQDFDAAITKRRWAYELAPDHPWCHVELMQCLDRAGRHEDFLAEASRIDFRHFYHMKPRENHDITPWERSVYVSIVNMTAQEPSAAVNLLRAVDYLIDAGIEGDFVECGVFRGASIVMMARALLRRGVTDRKIWLYDTFEGMPQPSEHDYAYDGTRCLDNWARRQKRGGEARLEMYGPIEDVEAVCRSTGYPMDRLTFVKGMVEDTIPAQAPDRIALLRLDTDYYPSTRHELEQLYPRLVRGGVLIIDDYGYHRGAQLATDNYIREHGLRLFLVRVNENVRFAIKLDD